ncbi:MAG: DoxX family protein [Bacteroidota bacterium]
MKRIKWIYYISTGLLTALMLMSAGMYFFNYGEVSTSFTGLGYPSFIIYPLAVAKVLGIIAIWAKESRTLTEWAYAGFFFDAVLAAQAHIMANDGNAAGAIIAIVLVLVSYNTNK